jgi:hypothetical protein
MAREPHETVYQYLVRRERELVTQLPIFQAEVSVRESELAHVRSAMRQISQLGGADKLRFGASEEPKTAIEAVSEAVAGEVARSGSPLTLLLSNETTIKDMILKTLWTTYRDNGATSVQLREYILLGYGRDIERTSFSPQLSRLKDEGLLKRKGGDDVWRLTLRGLDHCQNAWGVPITEPE